MTPSDDNGWDMPAAFITHPCQGCKTTSIDTVHPKGLCEACVTTIDAEWRKTEAELAASQKKLAEIDRLLKEWLDTDKDSFGVCFDLITFLHPERKEEK